jgi:hypothetical protein
MEGWYQISVPLTLRDRDEGGALARRADRPPTRAVAHAIEVKHTASLRPADLRGLRAFKEDYPEASLCLLYRGRETLDLDGIRCLPCEEFLRAFVPGNPLP